MADQIEIQLPVLQVEERSHLPLTAYFRTRATQAADTPTTVHYRVDCLTTEETVTDWTSVSAAANVSISITGTENKIRDGSNKWERKQITIKLDDGLSTQLYGRRTWKVNNVFGYT